MITSVPEKINFTEVMTEWTDLFMRRSMGDFHNFMRNWGLSMPQVSTLFRLHYRGGCGVSDIAQQLYVSNAAASQMVDRLEQQGLVERVHHPADRRVRMVQLTEQGHSLVKKGLEVRIGWISDLTHMLSPDQQETIVVAFAALTEAARQMETDTHGREE